MQTRIDPKAKSATYAFDSLAELARYIESAPRTWGYSNSSQDNPPEQDWDLGAGYAKCWDMARYGWLEGAARAEKALKAFKAATPAPDTRTDFYGYAPHVPRYCAGAPDSMIRKTESATGGAGAVLTLVVPVNAMAGVEAAHMANFGLGVAQYVNQLETNGVRVELYGAVASQVSGWSVCHTWRVKRADQPLDLAVLAFSIGHPGMFRRLGFALRERCAAPRDWGYGSTRAMTLKDFINPPAGLTILNGMKDASLYAKTPEAALAYIEKQINAALEAQAGK